MSHYILLGDWKNVFICRKALLFDHYHFVCVCVCVNEELSILTQGNVWCATKLYLRSCLVLFNYVYYYNIIRKHGMNFNCYANEIQIYISCRLENTSQFSKLVECINEIRKAGRPVLLKPDRTIASLFSSQYAHQLVPSSKSRQPKVSPNSFFFLYSVTNVVLVPCHCCFC